MKIKKSELKKANVTLEKTIDFLTGFLDYSTDEQTEDVTKLINDLLELQDKLYINKQINNKSFVKTVDKYK